MKSYRHTKSSISFLQCHIVFCPRYRRKIFSISGVKERFEEVTANVCNAYNIEILSIDFGVDYVHMHINASPDVDVRTLVHSIKSATAKVIKNEFPSLGSMTSLWTRLYLVTSEPELSESVKQEYISQQKTRP